jgi:hypothetical protein
MLYIYIIALVKFKLSFFEKKSTLIVQSLKYKPVKAINIHIQASQLVETIVDLFYVSLLYNYVMRCANLIEIK